MAITNWKGGDDDGASAHVHEQAVNGEEPTHWLHPQATILEANYNTTEAKADCDDDDINGVYWPIGLGQIIKAEVREWWQGFRHALIGVGIDPVHEEDGNNEVY